MQLPPELLVFLTSAMPFSELRGGIPLGVALGLSPIEAVFLAIFGNLAPVPFLLLFLEKSYRFLSKRSFFFQRFFNWLFERTRKNHSKKFEKYGSIALVPVVAVPLPVTGAWTGCAAAFVFGIKFKYALPAISLGVLIAGVIVTTLTIGGLSLT